ncbi:MAG TPA: carboxypeptidase regulatory-like domain-containing protein [Pyrinomonadaceae bacterium]
MINRFISALTFIVLGGGWPSLYACQCAGSGPPCQAAWQADAVFIATVVASREEKRVRDNDFHSRAVRLAVSESFRGLTSTDVEVYTGWGGGDCGFEFHLGEQYLVYAYMEKDDNRLVTSICSRTRPLAEASEDLSYLRNLPQTPSGSAISGEVHRYDRQDDGNPSDTPLSNVRVNIESDGKQSTVVTNNEGRFSLGGLSAGSYKVSVVPPSGLSSRQKEQTVTIEEKGCAAVYITVEPDGFLGGRVTNISQTPTQNAELFLIGAGKRKYQGYWDAQHSDKDGKYQFKLVPPGKYVLQIRFDGATSQSRPFPEMYYPGVSDVNRATIIAIDEGQHLEDYNLTMPELPKERVVEGTIISTDGKLLIEAKASYMGSDPIIYAVPIVSPGHFRLKVYEGIRITINAYLNDGRDKQIHSDPIQIAETGDYKNLKLVIPTP